MRINNFFGSFKFYKKKSLKCKRDALVPLTFFWFQMNVTINTFTLYV